MFGATSDTYIFSNFRKAMHTFAYDPRCTERQVFST